MSSSSRAVGKKVRKMGGPSVKEDIPQVWDVLSSDESESKEDEVHHLTGKNPFFDVIIGTSHVDPRYMMQLPMSFVKNLPRRSVPVVLRHGRKKWNLSYLGDNRRPVFNTISWKNFVTGNHLKIGDACVFELMDPSSTNLTFKVHILRGDLPPELLMAVDSSGETPDKPITIE